MSNAGKTALVKAPPKHVAPAKIRHEGGDPAPPAKIRHEGGDHAQLYRDIERMTPEQRQVMLLQRAVGNEPVSRLVSQRRMPKVYGAGPRLTGSASPMSARLGIGTAAGQ